MNLLNDLYELHKEKSDTLVNSLGFWSIFMLVLEVSEIQDKKLGKQKCCELLAEFGYLDFSLLCDNLYGNEQEYRKLVYENQDRDGLISKEDIMRYSGTIYLDYDDSEEEDHIEAKVSLFTKGNKMSFSFAGNKSEDAHPFCGSCSADLLNEEYKGKGAFSYIGEDEEKVSVNFHVEEDGEELFLEGFWKKAGDKQAYKLNIDVEKLEE